MAISLKNIEDRVKALEKRGVSGWQKGSANGGYYTKETTTGLIIQWGKAGSSAWNVGVTVKFPVAFTNLTSISVATVMNSFGDGDSGSWSDRIRNLSTTQFYTWANTGPIYWIAIGYLITDRLLNILYKAFARNIYTQLWQKLVSKFFTS